jgi:hypothetical protein
VSCRPQPLQRQRCRPQAWPDRISIVPRQAGQASGRSSITVSTVHARQSPSDRASVSWVKPSSLKGTARAACFACFTRSPARNAGMSAWWTHQHRPTQAPDRAPFASSRQALMQIAPSAARTRRDGSRPSRTIPVTVLISVFGHRQHVDGCSREQLLTSQQAAEWPGLDFGGVGSTGEWGPAPSHVGTPRVPNWPLTKPDFSRAVAARS